MLSVNIFLLKKKCRRRMLPKKGKKIWVIDTLIYGNLLIEDNFNLFYKGVPKLFKIVLCLVIIGLKNDAM